MRRCGRVATVLGLACLVLSTTAARPAAASLSIVKVEGTRFVLSSGGEYHIEGISLPWFSDEDLWEGTPVRDFLQRTRSKLTSLQGRGVTVLSEKGRGYRSAVIRLDTGELLSRLLVQSGAAIYESDVASSRVGAAVVEEDEAAGLRETDLVSLAGRIFLLGEHRRKTQASSLLTRNRARFDALTIALLEAHLSEPRKRTDDRNDELTQLKEAVRLRPQSSAIRRSLFSSYLRALDLMMDDPTARDVGVANQFLLDFSRLPEGGDGDPLLRERSFRLAQGSAHFVRGDHDESANIAHAALAIPVKEKLDIEDCHRLSRIAAAASGRPQLQLYRALVTLSHDARVEHQTFDRILSSNDDEHQPQDAAFEAEVEGRYLRLLVSDRTELAGKLRIGAVLAVLMSTLSGVLLYRRRRASSGRLMPLIVLVAALAASGAIQLRCSQLVAEAGRLEKRRAVVDEVADKSRRLAAERADEKQRALDVARRESHLNEAKIRNAPDVAEMLGWKAQRKADHVYVVEYTYRQVGGEIRGWWFEVNTTTGSSRSIVGNRELETKYGWR